MEVKLSDKTLQFEETPFHFKKRNLHSLFETKNNKTVYETLENEKYQSLKKEFKELNKKELNKPLGSYLKELKDSNDKRYLKFLNRNGDNTFCEFSIETNLNDKGIYFWVLDGEIKYAGRCTDNFKKRVNQGYGRINAKNCFKDGQSTNCHLNSKINKHSKVRFYIYKMTDRTKEEIHILEKQILAELELEWNVQKR